MRPGVAETDRPPWRREAAAAGAGEQRQISLAIIGGVMVGLTFPECLVGCLSRCAVAERQAREYDSPIGEHIAPKGESTKET